MCVSTTDKKMNLSIITVVDVIDQLYSIKTQTPKMYSIKNHNKNEQIKTTTLRTILKNLILLKDLRLCNLIEQTFVTMTTNQIVYLMESTVAILLYILLLFKMIEMFQVFHQIHLAISMSEMHYQIMIIPKNTKAENPDIAIPRKIISKLCPNQKAPSKRTKI
eukprot:UN27077